MSFQSDTRPKTLIALLVLLGLPVIVSCLVAETGGWNIWRGDELFALVILTLLCILPVILAIHRRRFDIFDPIYILSGEFFVIYVLGALVMIAHRLSEYEDIHRSELLPALVVAIVGLVGGYVGYGWGRLQFNHNRNPGIKRLFNRPYDPYRVFYWALIGLGVTVGFFLLWLFTSGRSLAYLNIVLGDNEHYQALDGSGSPLYFYLFMNSWPIHILLAWLFAPNRFWRLVVSGLWVLNGLIYFLSGNRGYIFVLGGATLILWYIHQQKRPSILVLALIALVAIWASGFQVVMRGPLPDGTALSAETILKEALDEISYRSSLYGLMITVRIFPQQADYIGFGMFSDLAIAWIPRILWPEKPVVGTAGQVLLENLGKMIAIAIGMLGHYYSGFGLPGAFGVFLVFGALNACIYEIWLSKTTGLFRQVFLSFWLIFFLIIIQRGNLDFFITRFVYTIGPMFIIWFLSIERRTSDKIRLNPDTF